MKRLKTSLVNIAESIWLKRGLWLRGALCWAVGMTFVVADSDPKYDTRFQIRSAQPASQDIVLVLISQDEWIQWQGKRRNWIRPLKEINQLSDSFYWSSDLWTQLLDRLLSEQPRSVGVSFFFGENIRRPTRRLLNTATFSDPRVKWAAHLDAEGRTSLPRFTSSMAENTGINELPYDRDGVIRRYGAPLSDIPHLAQRLAQSHPLFSQHSSPVTGESRLINFRGRAGAYATLSLTDVLNDSFPKNFFKDRIVIVGSRNSDGHTYRTPLGRISRAEIFANVVDNLIRNEWVHRIDNFLCALLLLGLLILSVVVISTYPQTVAFVFISFIGIGISVLSIWAFDAYQIWIPILAPVVLLGTTYTIFLSFQLSMKDYLNFQLEQERRFLLEVETLKDNFVSLISHDLKTPIAKIQAICDRLIAENPGHKIVNDIRSLRGESSELNRYIRTILHISRVEAKDFKINIDAADLNDTVESVIDQLQPLAAAKSIRIDYDLEPMFLIDIDNVLIHEVIHNIIGNAIKYTPPGGRISVTTKELNHRVILSVEDSGPGITKEELGQIFDKFYRGQGASAQVKGSGLGLYLVKYFVELHRGQVFADSDPGKGTKIGFSLPVTEEPSIEEPKGVEL